MENQHRTFLWVRMNRGLTGVGGEGRVMVFKGVTFLVSQHKKTKYINKSIESVK